ncbi:hypothetical protein [Acidipila sp. EB88]|uniref:hypothetical protein n=1 Tax=Acidipila sp. EB88 TaxID=2305226 RepID=UPI000F5E5086|nr:hypothetical protein [Acidipila sp. EB88]RRA48236.1 hypothetical protein D1Y84_07985 [Acidipila sp. EB88]
MPASTARAARATSSPLPRVISPFAHGIIDYAHVAFFCTVGLLCRRTNKRAAAAAFTTGGFILAQSLLTDYELGAQPLIPFETHGTMDTAFAAGSWLIPVLFGFAETRAARVFQLNSIAEATVVALTDWDNATAQRERREGASL